MRQDFNPAYKDFQKDIERYLISIGKREKSKDGMIVFWGYDDALKLIFQRYLDQGAFDPLVTHFKNWNWEVGYNGYLLELTAALLARRNWPLLQRLWDGVVAKQRKLYNQMWKIEKDAPGTLPSKQIIDSRELFLESLNRLIGFAEDIGEPGEMDKYAQMIERVNQGRKA